MEQNAWEDVRAQWTVEQLRLKQCLQEEDNVQWCVHPDTNTATEQDHDARPVKRLERVAGVDISFLKGSNEHACASIVVLQYPSLRVVYEAFTYVSLPAPYIPGFLAFREVPALTRLYEDLVARCPQYVPDITLVDGNGILHPQGFGLASHFGVLMDVPTIGVGKTFLHVDGLTKGDVRQQVAAAKTKHEQVVELQGESSKVWGAALCNQAAGVENPVFVSVGHKVSLDSSLRIVKACSRYRIPEPIRQADLRSRQVIRSWEKHGVDTTLDSYSIAASSRGKVSP
uniref:Endonuclease V n=1 Tax=Globisporangium ultimum (strain ATCC 200006 / CBS 805.95 / DAOM BR144) TaxID=431595 RepID=K3WTZ8_GLOUD